MNEEKSRIEKTITKLQDISTFGGYKITFTKSERGTADPAQVELEAKFPGDLSIAVEVMAQAISAYDTLLHELKKELRAFESRMLNQPEPRC